MKMSDIIDNNEISSKARLNNKYIANNAENVHNLMDHITTELSNLYNNVIQLYDCVQITLNDNNIKNDNTSIINTIITDSINRIFPDINESIKERLLKIYYEKEFIYIKFRI